MRTETKVIDIYKFDELSDKAKSKALEKFYDINVDHEWWEFTYDDAQSIGAKITGFDTGRGNSIDFKLTHFPVEVAKKIVLNHGQTCETAKLADQFLADLEGHNEEELERLETEFERALGEEYLSMLKKEYEYLTSEEAILETIHANEYEFTVDGKLY